MSKDTTMTVEQFMFVRTKIAQVLKAESPQSKTYISQAEHLIANGYIDTADILAQEESRKAEIEKRDAERKAREESEKIVDPLVKEPEEL